MSTTYRIAIIISFSATVSYCLHPICISLGKTKSFIIPNFPIYHLLNTLILYARPNIFCRVSICCLTTESFLIYCNESGRFSIISIISQTAGEVFVSLIIEIISKYFFEQDFNCNILEMCSSIIVNTAIVICS